jgi:phosphatidate phosphatase APP1
MAAKSKRFHPNMTTTTITNHPFRLANSRSLSRLGAIQVSKQAKCKNNPPSALNRWPASTKHAQGNPTVTTVSNNTYSKTYSNMKALNLRKFFLVALGLLAVVLFGMTLVEVKGLTVAGDTLGYAAALAILGLAALDTNRAKRLV